MRVRRLTSMMALVVLGSALAGCGAIGDDSAPYFPKEAPPTSDPSGALTGNVSTRGRLATVTGKVSRPNPALTPGAIAIHDVASVCKLPRRIDAPMTNIQAQAIFKAYGIPDPQGVGKYKLDYLVPLQLGGAATPANLWPISIRGVGFRQKEQINYVMRTRVCTGQDTLDQAQQRMTSDWYGAWLQYGG